jgi:hypothetical protein
MDHWLRVIDRLLITDYRSQITDQSPVPQPKADAQADKGKDDGRPALFEEIKRRNLSPFGRESDEGKKGREE